MNTQKGVALIMYMFIFVFVLFAIAAVLAFTQYEQNTEDQLEYDKLLAEKEKLEQTNREIIDERALAWLMVGFGAENHGDRANLQDAEDKLAEFRGKYNTVTESDNSLQKVLVAVDKAYDDEVRRANDANVKYQEAKQAEQSARDDRDATADAKDREIDQLSAQIQQEQDRGARNQQQNQSTIDSQRDRISALESELAENAETWKREKNELANKLLAMDARMQEINTRNHLIRAKEGPDGKIIDADDVLGLVYVDIGTAHGLKRGTPFQVFSYGKGKVRVPKGWIEIREVHADYSVAGITSQMDALDPIGAGDHVSNIYFDRDKSPEFVFLGELPGRYNNEEAERRLSAGGAKVAKSVSANTDFLVVGDQPPGQDDEKLEDSEPFRLAVQYGVEILRGQELVQFIKY